MASRSDVSKLLALAALDTPRESALRCRVIALAASVARVFPRCLTMIARRLGVSRLSTPSSDGPDVLVSEGGLALLFPPAAVVSEFLDVLQG